MKMWRGSLGRYEFLLDGIVLGVLLYYEPTYCFRVYINGECRELDLDTTDLVSAQKQSEEWLLKLYAEYITTF